MTMGSEATDGPSAAAVAGIAGWGAGDAHAKSERGWAVFEMLDRVLLAFCTIALALLCATVFVDVVTRLAGSPIGWLQEVCMLAFVWGLFMGSALAVRRNEHFVVFALGAALKGTSRKIVETWNSLVMCTLGIVVTTVGITSFRLGLSNHMPITRLPESTLIAPLILFGALTVAFTLERLILGWTRDVWTVHAPATGDALLAGKG